MIDGLVFLTLCLAWLLPLGAIGLGLFVLVAYGLEPIYTAWRQHRRANRRIYNRPAVRILRLGGGD